MATLSDTLFMIPRELPTYLKVAYSIRYKDEPNTGNYLERIIRVVQRTFTLIKELIAYRPQHLDFYRNREQLNTDFEKINNTLLKNEKPLCVYFVSAHDDNGAILGNHLYYYHHYKIQGLQKHFAVAPKIVSSQNEMKDFIISVRNDHPDKEIKFVDVVTHGGKSSLEIGTGYQTSITPKRLRKDLFSDCADDATILLDACATGLGDRNIADEIARATPGRTILAAGPSMYFSKPVIQVRKNQPRVVSAVHGFAIFNAYTCKSFSYKTGQPSQYPYVKDRNLKNDIRSMAASSLVRNRWLDPFIKEDRNDFKQQILDSYNQLSEETKTMVIKKICENKSTFNDADCEEFLTKHPLDSCVLSAFRSIFNELTHEVREYPSVKWIKLGLSILNMLQVAKEAFRSLVCRQPVAPLLTNQPS